MSAFSAAQRAVVEARAGFRCEFCRLPTRGQVATFPIDHLLPKARGGTNDIENLALSCPWCNSRKWCSTEWTDQATGDSVGYFNPRLQDWHEHFDWEGERLGVLIGKTPAGRATIDGLKLNDPLFVALRVVLLELGLFEELGG